MTKHHIIVELHAGRAVKVRGNLPSVAILETAELLQWATWLNGEVELVAGGVRVILPRYPRHAPVGDVGSALSRARVLAALEDPRWKFRTISGIANTTGLTEAEVREAIHGLGRTVRRPLAPDASGRDLYAAASRKPSWRERYLALRKRLGTW